MAIRKFFICFWLAENNNPCELADPGYIVALCRGKE